MSLKCSDVTGATSSGGQLWAARLEDLNWERALSHYPFIKKNALDLYQPVVLPVGISAMNLSEAIGIISL